MKHLLFGQDCAIKTYVWDMSTWQGSIFVYCFVGLANEKMRGSWWHHVKLEWNAKYSVATHIIQPLDPHVFTSSLQHPSILYVL